MSTVKTYLTLVFTLEGDMIRATEYFGEQDAKQHLEYVDILWPADRKEIHLSFDIIPPLTREQLDKLTWMKEMGICSNFYVRDEISQ